MMARVSVTGDAECDAIFPHEFPERSGSRNILAPTGLDLVASAR